MKVNQKYAFCTLFPAILGGISLNAAAEANSQPGASQIYTYSADLNYAFSSFELESYDPYSSDQTSYRIDLSSYINQDFTNNFTIANPSISGQFSYSSADPLTSSYSNGSTHVAYYNSSNESFTIDLHSESGNPGQIMIDNNSRGYRSTSILNSAYNNTHYQRWTTSGFSSSFNNVTLRPTNTTFCNEMPGCTPLEYTITGFRPQDTMMNGMTEIPAFFNDIDSFSFRLSYDNYFDPFYGDMLNIDGHELQLTDISMQMSFSGNDALPVDSSLPAALPSLADADSAHINLSFSNDTTLYDPSTLTVDVWDIAFSADSPYYTDFTNVNYNDSACQQYPGCGSSLYEMNKMTLISDFFTNSTLISSAYIDYTLTELTPTSINDGLTAQTPLLPVADNNPNDGVFNFSFTPNSNGFTFIDPDVAVGYDYEITSNNNYFTDVLLPTGYGDNLFDLWLFDTNTNNFYDSGNVLTGGISYNFLSDFGLNNISLFRIMGIETSEFLDPNDANAFVTGFQFADNNVVTTVSQTAKTVFVPEPATFMLFMSGMTFLACRRKV